MLVKIGNHYWCSLCEKRVMKTQNETGVLIKGGPRGTYMAHVKCWQARQEKLKQMLNPGRLVTANGN